MSKSKKRVNYSEKSLFKKVLVWLSRWRVAPLVFPKIELYESRSYVVEKHDSVDSAIRSDWNAIGKDFDRIIGSDWRKVK